ncbi:hypothetical protein Acel_1782 [Acidothermus cellulolyticus 11B]|jgi:uncharacterized membrane protein|uniref:Uncharacterized protein n=1 Tax=Acidothermus cellulolyticus (strain ATCC 43068 / DSM 8971 / 11B) TaxID=351607 RepID=A0LVU4_ACIC1|nr:hypothetical protein [Acidothermus cellulolyticus]ABK53554.1 hypothetical protein Acel_1782 [Acidothermus cellulolyticus 11B]
MAGRPLPPDPSVPAEVPEADAAEQQTEAARDSEETGEAAPVVPRITRKRWEADAVDPDDERVVVLDEDDYR